MAALALGPAAAPGPVALGDCAGVQAVVDSFVRLLQPLRQASVGGADGAFGGNAAFHGGGFGAGTRCSTGGAAAEAFAGEAHGSQVYFGSSTMFQKLPAWFANATDDGDTISPASDLRTEHRSGTSDGGSGSARSHGAEASGSGWACSDDDEGYAGGAPQPLWPPAGRGCNFSPPATSLSPPAPAPRDWGCQVRAEAQLVDLDPAEGKRRGGELLSMLFEKPGRGASRADAPPPGVQAAPGGPLRAPGPPPGLRQGPGAVASAAAAAQSATPRAPSAQAPAAPERRGATRQAAQAGAIYEAARRAFGMGSVDVVPTASGGFAVWLYGGAGSGAEEARTQQAALHAFGRALWPLLGPEAVCIEWRGGHSVTDGAGCDGHLGAPPGSFCEGGAGAASAACGVGAPRLTIWCLCEDEEYSEDLCWDFTRRGACPRGNRCQWLHVPPPTYPVDVEVDFRRGSGLAAGVVSRACLITCGGTSHGC